MVHDLRYFDKYVQKCGSRYSATVFVAAKARYLTQKYDNVISFAEALTWVLSGQIPKGVTHYKEIISLREQRSLGYAKEYLAQVHDTGVRESVLKSLEKTKQNGHLIYFYDEVYDQSRQARIRILTNKLWYEMKQQEM